MRPGSEDGRIVAFNLMENSDRNAAILIAGDGVAFVAFAVIGLSGHERQVSVAGMMRAGLPFLLAWLPFAWGLGLFRPSWLTSKAWQSVLIAWLPACGVGLLIRSLAFGQSFAPTFALVSLVTNGALLVGWRMLYAKWLSRSDVGA